MKCFYFTILLVLIITPRVSYSAEITNGKKDDKGIFNIVIENDLFTGNDSNYTNGTRFAWLSSEKNVPEFAQWIANNFMSLTDVGNRRISISAGQKMFTPSNKTKQTIVINDRPYAGWLYGSVGVVSDTGNSMDNMLLTVGMVGPSSQAKPTQQYVHHAIGSNFPKGWDNQLHDEFGVILTYEHKWRNIYQATPFGVGIDSTPNFGINLGNINTDASIGLMTRIGYDLPNDYGPPRIRPSLPGSDFFIPTKEISGYLFAGVEGKIVGRNIFLDGNTFRESHHIDKENVLCSAQVGTAFTYHDLRISYSQIYMTKEFTKQEKAENFGAVTISYRF